MRLLLIDDNKDLIDGLQAILELEDYEVDTSYNYQSALDLINKNNYDVIFIDGKLDNHNGFEIFDIYRQTGGQSEVVIMSAYRCEQIIDFLVSPEQIQIIHEPDKVRFNDTTGSLVVNIILSKKCPELVQQATNNSSNAYTLIQSANDLNKLEPDAVEILIHTDLKVMENILLLYRIFRSHGDKRFTLLVDSSKNSIPLKEFSSCGCLLKPFEPEDMIDVIKQLSATIKTEAYQL